MFASLIDIPCRSASPAVMSSLIPSSMRQFLGMAMAEFRLRLMPPNSNTLEDSTDDGISIEPSIGLNMAWTQFEYSQDVDLKISTIDGSPLGSPEDVIIRPTSIKYSITSSDSGDILVRIPYDQNGRKFSIEFKNDLYTFRSDGKQYVSSGGDVVGIEPTNALTMTPGPIRQGDWGAKPILYFPPGVYYMDEDTNGVSGKLGSSHMILDPQTYWVYIAPGAYVKGAIEYTTHASKFYATGHGVLSGEHYVYQANVDKSYTSHKSDATSLRMWWHNSIQSGQKWFCHGPTVNAPPFNTMDFNGDVNSISSEITDYKQVGAYFFQTDGPQIYPNSVVRDVFWHVNDDALKIYYSGASVSRATIWKCLNDPIIQMGWTTRNAHGVTINTLNVIHTRYRNSQTDVPTTIIGASPFYQGGKADPKQSISLTVSKLICEGPCPSLVRIVPLQSYRDFVVENVAFPDGLQRNSIGIGQSIIPAAPGVEMDLQISNWTVGGERVTMKNFQSGDLGQLNIDESYWGQWSIS
ncbi:dextranase [Penicillium chermesinum]|nr:dextranase [Penicillium chermesinum]